jgi:hypothetical protein
MVGKVRLKMFYLVGQTLKFVCVEMVVIPQDVVVAGTTGALQKKKNFVKSESIYSKSLTDM